jgi:hypothetical protein
MEYRDEVLGVSALAADHGVEKTITGGDGRRETLIIGNFSISNMILKVSPLKIRASSVHCIL